MSSLRTRFGLSLVILVCPLWNGCALQKESSLQREKADFKELVEFRPSGPTTIRTWREPLTGGLIKIELVGVVSGRALFPGARLLRNTLGEWRVTFDDGSACLVYRNEQDLPYFTHCTDPDGVRWFIEVSNVYKPVAVSGIAMEDEHKLTISLKN